MGWWAECDGVGGRLVMALTGRIWKRYLHPPLKFGARVFPPVSREFTVLKEPSRPVVGESFRTL